MGKRPKYYKSGTKLYKLSYDRKLKMPIYIKKKDKRKEPNRYV
jgi:hypothetical protein